MSIEFFFWSGSPIIFLLALLAYDIWAEGRDEQTATRPKEQTEAKPDGRTAEI